MPAVHRSVFLQAGCPSCCPTNSVKALKATFTESKGVKTYINDINIFSTLDFVKGVLSNMKPIAFILVLSSFLASLACVE